MSKQSPFFKQRQQGMVSIMVTMLLMVVISLIVLGFAQVSRSELRESLDRQLSSQAFFAAESAVNDARKTVQEQLATGQTIPEKNDCASNADYPYNPILDATNNVSYTCLLVTSRVKSLVADVPLNGPSIKLPLETPTSPISKLHINWKASSTPSATDFNKCRTSLPSTAYFDPTADWNCPLGVMRLEIVPTNSLNHSSLASGQKVMYLYPIRGSSAATRAFASSNGAVVRMSCSSASSGCDVDITGVNGNSFAIKISAVYVGGKFNITATNAAGDALTFQNAQVQIDATGRAQDVLRRIQVRLPLLTGAETADYAIESGSSICKRFEYSITLPVANANDIAGQDQNNPMCK